METRTLCMIVSVIILGIGLTIIIWLADNQQATNPYIMDIPKKVVSGNIYNSPGGMFSSGGPTRYILHYQGKRKSTNETCETSRRVTESEYEHQIYGG